MEWRELGTVLLAVLCIASLGLAGANLVSPDVGPAEALGGETDPSLTGDDPLETNGDGETTDNETGEGGGSGEGDAGEGDGTGDDGPGDEEAESDETGDGSEEDAEERDDGDDGPNGDTDEDTPGGDGDDEPTDGDQQAGDSTTAGSYEEQDTVGGPVELGEQEELVFEALELTKLRLGAYSTYTGDGWERDTGDRERVSGPIATDGNGDPEPKYEIHVTTRRSFDSLAAPWRPAYADADREVYVDDNKGLTVDEPFEANEEYTTVTYGPPSEREARAVSGDSYPEEIESRYTQLPDDTPDRLEEHTAEITADAETPYEVAVAIDSWLKENKDYSLDASHDPDNDVADEFVFEMDAGYCEYFATVMTAMLRTQGIPTRYVTGYGYGEEIGEDKYLLRGANAHTWVEVYFEDIGWVTFDPTPSDGREDANRDAQRPGEDGPSDDDGEQDGGEEGDEQEESETDQEDDSEPEQEGEEEGTGPLEVSVDSDPVPGAGVTVTVTQDGALVSDAEVFFNDDSIGLTDGSGQTTGEVPYEDELEITVERNGGTEQPQFSGGQPPLAVSQAESAEKANISFDLETNISISISQDTVPGTEMEVQADIAGVPVTDAQVEVANGTARTDDDGVARIPVPFQREAEVTVTRGDTFGNESMFLLYNLTLNVPDEAAAGTETEASVTVADEPVEDARVEVANQTVTTEPNGTATIELPFEESATVTAERGEFAASQEISLDTDLDVAVDGRVAPGFEATITVTNGGDPVEDVAVALGGSEYATTDANGEASVRLFILGASTTVVAERGAASGSAGPYPVWPYWLAYAAVLVVVASIVAWRAGLLNRARDVPGRSISVPRRIASAIDQAIRRVAVAAVEAAVRVTRFVRRTVAALRRWITAAARDLTGTLIRTTHGIRERLIATNERVLAVVKRLRDPAAWKTVVLWLAAIPERVVNWIRQTETDATDRESTARNRLTEMDNAAVRDTLEEWLDEEPDEEDIDYFERILEAWEELEATADRRPEWTPTELADHACRQGYPRDSVDTLTRAFQQIRYGNCRPTAEMAATAADAAESLTHTEAD